MRKFNWQILLLALWPYAGVLLLEVLRQSASWTLAPVLAWMAGLLIVCVVNIVHAFRVQDRAVLPGMLAKLMLIPYYAMTFVYGVLLFAAPPAVIILFLLNGLLLLATSATPCGARTLACAREPYQRCGGGHPGGQPVHFRARRDGQRHPVCI